MGASAFFGLTAWLYYLCFALLAALVLGILLRRHRPDHPDPAPHPAPHHPGRPHPGQHRSLSPLPRLDAPLHFNHQARLRAAFFRLAAALLGWQLTLFAETRTVSPSAQEWLGRLNFAAMALAPYLAWRFVQAVSFPSAAPWLALRVLFWYRVETALLTIVTLWTPWVDAAERVEAGHAISTFGPLFPLYAAHSVGYWAAALGLAFRERGRAAERMTRDQLTLIGGGMLTTGGIAVITNLLLPYGWGDFRWCDLGALSTLLFLLAIAYATLRRGLFEVRVLVRQTVVYGLLLAFVLGGYSSAVFVLSQALTEGAGRWTQFVVLLLAFSFDPWRRFLEEKVDRLLFGPPDDTANRDQSNPDWRSPNWRSPNWKGPDRRSPDRRSPDRRSPDRRSPDRRSPDRKGPDRKGPDGSNHPRSRHREGHRDLPRSRRASRLPGLGRFFGLALLFPWRR
jgi:hypothetical protein